MKRQRVGPLALASIAFALVLSGSPSASPPTQAVQDAPRNVILILSDDHRYDFMSFMEGAPSFLQTPSLDRMAKQGAHIQNAFVTTALCSPSRASILTGQYAHRHGIVDNTSPIPVGTTFFPQHLQRAGYRTAYIGKWHMGEVDDVPQPGFDHWVSFRGQGVYSDPTLNINGKRQQIRGYTTDILTAQALDWLKRQTTADPERPFFLYLSHKAVHAEFEPDPRHRGRYANAPIPYPETMADTEANYRNKPRWVKEQRNSWHGVDFMYHGAMQYDDFYRAYAETLLALDEGVGRVLDYLDYYWEYAFPHTPTTLALRGDRYKFIYYPGVWDLQELYDLQTDPKERNNLIDAPEHQERVIQMRRRLWDLLEASGGMSIPLKRGSFQANQRKGGR